MASSHQTASHKYLHDCCAGCGQLNAAVSASRQKLHCRIIRYLVLFLKGVDKDAIPAVRALAAASTTSQLTAYLA
jgi:hypothetical protein